MQTETYKAGTDFTQKHKAGWVKLIRRSIDVLLNYNLNKTSANHRMHPKDAEGEWSRNGTALKDSPPIDRFQNKSSCLLKRKTRNIGTAHTSPSHPGVSLRING